MAKPVDRYKLALLLLTLAVVPLFYLNIWLGMDQSAIVSVDDGNLMRACFKNWQRR